MQLTFELKNSNRYNINEYIVSSSNKEVYEFIINSSRANFGVRPYNNVVLIKGQKSSGKTFLAEIWKSLNNGFSIHQDLDLANFHKLPECIVVDGAENFDEEKLLHIFNNCYEGQKLCLITAFIDHQYKLNDLMSRLNSIKTFYLDRPDDELIKVLLFKEFSQNSVLVDSKVIEYLLKIIPREFNQIAEIGKKINQYALGTKKPITISLVKSVIFL